MEIARDEYFGRCIGRCESPIERRFLAALFFLCDHSFDPFDRQPVIARDGLGIELGQQVSVGPYRLDFAFTCCGETRYAIEIDGYAYHGATPEQFERDASRQRVLTAHGWTVLRFAGREIVRDAAKCAQIALGAATEAVRTRAPVREHVAPGSGPDPELEELRRELADAESMGDWQETLRLLGQVQRHARDRMSRIS